MDFGEKLLQLRKSKGMSQESLAEQLNTSRQAVSKWENGQGYPETEKLLLISNIFNVSIDYLLKERVEPILEHEAGYYVSKETVECFLIFERKTSKYSALGIVLGILSVCAYFLLQATVAIIVISVLVAAAVGVIVVVTMMEDQYKPLRKEPLIFDERVLKELKQRYASVRKKYIVSMIVGATLLLLLKKGLMIFEGEMNMYYAGSAFFIAIEFFIFIQVVSMMEAYELLIKNEEYQNALSTKLSKRFRDKLNHL